MHMTYRISFRLAEHHSNQNEQFFVENIGGGSEY